MALDSLRGLCAVIVALFHFNATGVIANLPLVSNGWLFVDFFFVLSGFVIAAAYRHRIAAGFSPLRFMWLRFWRLYPLYLAILFVFLGSELLLQFDIVGSHRTPFGEGRSLADLIYGLLFVNCFGLADQLGWNGPSWSIGAEWWAYSAFAVIELTARRRADLVWIVVAIIAAIILIATGGINRTFDWGVLRALLGFGIGTLAFTFHAKLFFFVKKGSSGIEFALLSMCLAFIVLAPRDVHVLAPLIFGIVVCVFATSNGVFSKLLQSPTLVGLGALSYSLYLWHSFVQARIMDALQYLTPDYIDRTEKGTAHFTGPGWMGDTVTAVMMLVLILVSIVSYRLIELPGQRFGKRTLGARDISADKLRDYTT